MGVALADYLGRLGDLVQVTMTDVLKVPEAATKHEKYMATKSLWKLSHVAEHLGVTIAKARDLANKKGFPQPIQLIGSDSRMRRWFPCDFDDFSLDQLQQINPKCHLYHHYDANDELLYVGISLSAIGRLRQHNRQSRWADQIVKILVTHYDSVEDAREAEAKAIRWEQPKYNKMLNKRRAR